MSRFLLAAITILLTVSCVHSIPIEPTVSTPIPPIESQPPSAIDGSLLAITREKIGATSADVVKSISHTIAPHAQAKAAEFVAQLDRLVEGFKAKSHIARLTNKYTKKNATLSHAIEHDAIDSHTQEDDHHDNLAARQEEAAATMEDGPSQFEPLPSHMDESNANSHFPKPTLLEPVPSKRRRAKRHLVEDKEYVLYSIQLPPTQPSPSGFNFTSFIYPTPEGNVTIYVGITEYPLGKFHFYPSPRDQLDDISLSEAAASSPMKAPLKASALSPMRKRLFPSFLETGAQVQFNSLCDGVATTSVSANSYGCIFAQNAGFFNVETHACMGNVVSDDQYINHAAAGLKGRPHFGFTRKGNFITGYLTVAEAANGVDGGFHELTQGQGWLIRDGKNYLEQSVIHENLDSGFVTEKAPRNAIGHDSQGRLLMFQADGEEDIKLGLTLPEFADILAHHFKVENAINVDGGGSSTTVYKGQVVDKPTCRDTPEICERPVTTISCVLP